MSKIIFYIFKEGYESNRITIDKISVDQIEFECPRSETKTQKLACALTVRRERALCVVFLKGNPCIPCLSPILCQLVAKSNF